jgi:hypothetical protein
VAKKGRKVSPEQRAEFAEKRRAQVAALKEQLAEWQDEAGEELIAEVLARFDGYSERNAMLIAMQDPEATDVEGFVAWLNRGRCVRKGESGIKILAPAGQGKAGEVTTESGKPEVVAEWGDPTAGSVEGSSAQPRQFFKIAYVFDIRQTDPAEARVVAAEPAA